MWESTRRRRRKRRRRRVKRDDTDRGVNGCKWLLHFSLPSNVFWRHSLGLWPDHNHHHHTFQIKGVIDRYWTKYTTTSRRDEGREKENIFQGSLQRPSILQLYPFLVTNFHVFILHSIPVIHWFSVLLFDYFDDLISEKWCLVFRRTRMENVFTFSLHRVSCGGQNFTKARVWRRSSWEGLQSCVNRRRICCFICTARGSFQPLIVSLLQLFGGHGWRIYYWLLFPKKRKESAVYSFSCETTSLLLSLFKYTDDLHSVQWVRWLWSWWGTYFSCLNSSLRQRERRVRDAESALNDRWETNG